MRVVTVQPGEVITLGYQYDNEATRIIFPSEIISPIPATYGAGGSFAIWYRRSGDALGYPIGNPLVQYANDTVTWDITEAELANPGASQVQLRYIVDEVCVMSQIFPGNVADSVDIGSDIPEPMEAWADAIVRASYGNGTLWTVQDVYLFRQLLSHIEYDSASAATIAEELLESLESTPEDQAWTMDEIDLLDQLLSHVIYTDADGGEYADALIASLKGQTPTYEDADEVEY